MVANIEFDLGVPRRETLLYSKKSKAINVLYCTFNPSFYLSAIVDIPEE